MRDMPRAIILHHVEEMWEQGYDSHGTSFEEVADNLVDYLSNAHDFEKVILVRFESAALGDEHYLSGLSEFVTEVEEYGYGWEREMMEEQDPEGEDIRWGDGCTHSEVVLLDDWIKALKGYDVTVTGAFAGECVETLTTALDHCNIVYEEVPELIIGTGVAYEPRAPMGMGV